MLPFSVMWRDLPVIKLRAAYTEKKPYLDFLTEMLKWSHNTPIRLCIIEGENTYISYPAIDVLVLHSNRWQEKIHAQLDFMPAFQKIKGRLESLQSLCLSSIGTTDPMLNYTACDLFCIAPQLRHVDLTGRPSEIFHSLLPKCRAS